MAIFGGLQKQILYYLYFDVDYWSFWGFLNVANTVFLLMSSHPQFSKLCVENLEKQVFSHLGQDTHHGWDRPAPSTQI